jgi:hypothetical protein
MEAPPMPSFISYIFDTCGPITTFFGVSVPGIVCLKLIGVLVRLLKDPPPPGKVLQSFWRLFFGNMREWLLWAALISIVVSVLIAILSSQALAQKDEKIAQLERTLQKPETGSSAEGRIKVHAYAYPGEETWQAQVEVRPTSEIWELPVVCLPLDEQQSRKLELGNGAIGGNPGLMHSVQHAPTETKDGKWAAFHRETAITPSDCLYILGKELPSRFVLLLTDTNEQLAFDLDQKTGQYLPALR